MNIRIVLISSMLLIATAVVPAAEPTGSSRNGDQAALPGPAISMPVTQFDFGTVVDGSEVLHEFLIRNTGNAPLRVIQINTG